jgi:hypothetical protein
MENTFFFMSSEKIDFEFRMSGAPGKGEFAGIQGDKALIY